MMKFNVIWFSLTACIVGAFFSLVLFIWCSVNGFGAELVRLFESVHPSGGFSIIENMDASFLSKIPGILINFLYSAVDFLVAGFAFSSVYNLLLSKFDRE